MKDTLRADDIHAVAVNDRAGTRPVVIPIAILKRRRIAMLPVPFTGLRMQAIDYFLLQAPVQEHQFISRQSRRRIPRSFSHFPDQRRPARWKLFANPRLTRNAVMTRPQKRRPVLGHCVLLQRPGLLVACNIGIGCRHGLRAYSRGGFRRRGIGELLLSPNGKRG